MNKFAIYSGAVNSQSSGKARGTYKQTCVHTYKAHIHGDRPLAKPEAYTSTHACTYAHMQAHIYTQKHTHTNAHTCRYIQTNIHTHTNAKFFNMKKNEFRR